MTHLPHNWLQPEWPAPAHVRAVMTDRQGGQSLAPWDSLNLGDHVGDDPAHVQANRQQLQQRIGTRPVFLKQVHGVKVQALHAQVQDGTDRGCLHHGADLAWLAPSWWPIVCRCCCAIRQGALGGGCACGLARFGWHRWLWGS